jgi:hypothetical protein
MPPNAAMANCHTVTRRDKPCHYWRHETANGSYFNVVLKNSDAETRLLPDLFAVQKVPLSAVQFAATPKGDLLIQQETVIRKELEYHERTDKVVGRKSISFKNNAYNTPI